MAISKLALGGVKPFSLKTNYMLDLPLGEHTHHEWKLQQKADLTKNIQSKEKTYFSTLIKVFGNEVNLCLLS